MKTLTRQTAMILAVALAAAVLFNVCSPKGIPWVKDWDRHIGQQAHAHGINPLDAGGVPALIETGVIVLDARNREEYAKGRLPGALSLPYTQRDTAFGDFSDWLTPDLPLLIYCAGGTCDEALRLAIFFRNLGYEKVHILSEGFSGWRRQGLPVE